MIKVRDRAIQLQMTRSYLTPYCLAQHYTMILWSSKYYALGLHRSIIPFRWERRRPNTDSV